ncbi:MAG: RluA family pseudouridine synthase [Bryobacterales bacterium]|nr:RluA family pseudouridine synthase [Bryobacterales bacterium]
MQRVPDSPLHLTTHPADAQKRLDHFLQERLPEHSRARLQEWIKAGRVRIHGEPATKPSLTLRGGEEIRVEPAAAPPLRAFAEDLPVQVLYEDSAVIAVDKPAGMVVHLGAGHHQGTLVNALLHRFGALAEAGGGERPGIVHRLDRDTSGVLLVARTDAAHRALAAQFAARTVDKIYLALAHGLVARDHGFYEQPIERDPVRRTRMTARTGRGRAARTEYRVLRRFADQRLTYLEVTLHTGRTHQIRVHLAHAGHPVVGDTLYGAPAHAPVPLSGRFFLHAHRIAFNSPGAGGRRITVTAPLPPELAAALP